jgi:hypothetical protein
MILVYVFHNSPQIPSGATNIIGYFGIGATSLMIVPSMVVAAIYATKNYKE